MKDGDDIVSGFGDDVADIVSFGQIDFSRAKKLERNGSACDAYVTRYQRRKVFVKRLRVEFRTSPRHLAALDKEYDLGVSLKHRSLPEYREIHGDYIVMDYIDGVTLEEMINVRDPWLLNVKNVRNMLNELIDVIDYLHQHHVVHCDIKTDNIMLTHGNRTLVLLDLDKAFSSWLDDTSGDANLYGVSATGSMDIDFHGVGKIVERMSNKLLGFPSRKFKGFLTECFRNGVTPDELRNKLSSNKKRSYVIMFSALCGIFATTLLLTSSHNPVREEETPKELQQGDTHRTDTVVLVHNDVDELYVKDIVKETITESEVKASGFKAMIEQEMPVRIQYMDKVIREAEALIADTASTNDQLYDMMYTIIENQSDLTMKAYEDFQKQFPDEKPLDIQNTVVSCEAYTDMIRKNDELVKRLSEEMTRRKPITSAGDK